MVRKIDNKALFYSTFTTFMLLVVVPVFYTFFSIFTDNNISSAFSQSLHKDTFLLLLKSSLLAFIIAFFSTLAGSIIGFIVFKTKIPYRRIIKLVLLIPLFVSPYIFAVAWRNTLRLFIGNQGNISGYLGFIIVMVSIYSPLAMFIVGSSLTKIDASMEEAGLLLTNTKKVITKVILPLIKPALFTSFILIFIFSISAYAVPAFFGIRVFSTEIFTQFSAFYNYSTALIQAIFLVMISLGLLLSEYKYIADAPFLSVGNKGTNFTYISLKKYKYVGLLLVILWILKTILLPIIILIKQSFKEDSQAFLQAIKLLAPTFLNSISIAFVSSLITVLVGFVTAYYASQHQNLKWAKYLDFFLLLIFAIPSLIFGISLLKFYNHPYLNFIYSGYGILIIAFVGKFSFIASKSIANSLKQIPVSFEEAGSILSIGFYKRLQKIVIPILFPTLIATFIINFIFILSEVGISIMIYPPGTEILSIKVFTIMANAPQSLTSAMALVVFLITLSVVPILYFLSKKLFNNTYHPL